MILLGRMDHPRVEAVDSLMIRRVHNLRITINTESTTSNNLFQWDTFVLMLFQIWNPLTKG
jgi:hypothetical protein